MYKVHEGFNEILAGNHDFSGESSKMYEYGLRNRSIRGCSGRQEKDLGGETVRFKHDFKTSFPEKERRDLGVLNEKHDSDSAEGNSNTGNLNSFRTMSFGDASKSRPPVNGFSRQDSEELNAKKKVSPLKRKEVTAFNSNGREADLRANNKCPLNQTNSEKASIGGFRDSGWYKRIPDWERIIEERHSTVYRSYERLEMIGTGTYAKVWLLKDKVTGKKYAGKLLEPHTYPSDTVDRIEKMFQSEIENLIISQCPGVVRLHKIIVGPEGSLLVQDYVDDGTIWRENCCVGEVEAFQHFIQLIQSVLFLQDKGVVHRDLKPTNILRYSDRKIVIGDFGWSERTSRLHLNPLEWPGTLEINPPEVLTFKGPLTEKIDNYAIGMNLLLFLTGRFICRQKGLDVTEAAPYILKVVELIRNDFNNKILSRNKQKCGTNSHSELKQNQCFMWEIFIGFTDPNPETRWTIKKALFHPECIRQLIQCFNNSNFNIIWHPQIISVIKSNLIPNSISVPNLYTLNASNANQHRDGLLDEYQHVIKSNVSNKNTNHTTYNIKVCDQGSKNYMTLVATGSVSSNVSNEQGLINNFSGYDTPNLGFNDNMNLPHNRSPVISTGDSEKFIFKQNQQQMMMGASLKQISFSSNQKVSLKNNSLQPHFVLSPNISSMDSCFSTSSLFNGDFSPFRYQSTSSSYSPSVNSYFTGNQRQSNIDGLTRQDSHYMSNAHY